MHTKGEWKWVHHKEDKLQHRICIIMESPERAKHIADIYYVKPEDMSNAKRICQCVNNFDGLLEVLKQIHRDYQEFVDTEDGDTFDERMGANIADAEVVVEEAEKGE